MGNINFSYYYGKEAEQFSFFRIPKLLFTDKNFSSLSSDAKVLYGILLDRMSLSMKNNWIDEENRVYIIFTIEEIAETLACGTQKATKILQELDTTKGIGLVEKKRLGLGKPSILYIKNFVVENNEDISKTLEEKQDDEITKKELLKPQLLNCENHNSGNMKITNQELLKSQSNKTNINNTDFSYTDNNKTSPLSPSQEKEQKQKIKQEEVKKKIRENIDYKSLVKDYADINLIDSIVDIMTESIESKKDLKINQVYKNYEDIRKQFLSIKKEHIRYVLDYLNDNKPKIINFRAYILSLLYNAPLNIIKIDKPKSLEDYYSNDNKLLQELIGGIS